MRLLHLSSLHTCLSESASKGNGLVARAKSISTRLNLYQYNSNCNINHSALFSSLHLVHRFRRANRVYLAGVSSCQLITARRLGHADVLLVCEGSSRPANAAI